MIYLRCARSSRDPISFMQIGHYCRLCSINKSTVAKESYKEVFTKMERGHVYFRGFRVLSKDMLTGISKYRAKIGAKIRRKYVGDFFVDEHSAKARLQFCPK